MNRFGWRPDYPDYRDFPLRAVMPAAVEVPMVKNLITPPVLDQGDLGSCVFHALATHMEAVMVANRESSEWWYLSPLFGYYNYREAHGSIDVDQGAHPRLALKQAASDGICRESLWPYRISSWRLKPPAEAYTEARNHRVHSYFRLQQDISEMLACIASGYGFICGVSVYESFLSDYTERTGKVVLPQRGEAWLGGHAVYICGHDKHARHFLGQNSWGTGWGNKGRFTIPFDYLADAGLAGDFWTIRMLS
jgi:C1A family cysteine protease